MKRFVHFSVIFILIVVTKCYDGILQEQTRDLSNFFDQEVERIIKSNNLRVIQKRSNEKVSKSDIYEGSGDYSNNIAIKPRKNLKGYVKESFYNADNDLHFENDNDNENNDHIDIISSQPPPSPSSSPEFSTTTLKEKFSSTTSTKFEEITTRTTTTTSTQTKPSPTPSSTVKPSSISSSKTTETTTTSKPSDCVKETCNLIWANFSAIIEPKHITTLENTDYQLECALRNDETKNITLPDGSKIFWTVNLNLNEDNENIDAYYPIPDKLTPKYSGTENEIVSFKNATEFNAGAYLCLILLPDKCCEKKKITLVRIYKKPDYALHLIITGAICGVQLIACIPFALYTRRRMYAHHQLAIAEPDDEQKLIV